MVYVENRRQPSQRRTVVTARIHADDLKRLRQIAEENDSTVSRLIARAVARDLAARSAAA